MVYPKRAKKRRRESRNKTNKQSWKDCTVIQTAKGSKDGGRKGWLTERKEKGGKLRRKENVKKLGRKEGKQLPVNNQILTEVNRK